jgi:hypothetical protein
LGCFCSCKLWLSWDGVGGFLSFFFWAVFFISSIAFSLVYCRCTKGRLTLLIKSVYYLSKKIIACSDEEDLDLLLIMFLALKSSFTLKSFC